MKMRFKHPKAAAYLLKHGFVVTARPTQSSKSGPVQVEIEGKTYPGARIWLGNVFVGKVGRSGLDKLASRHVEQSGFRDAAEWADAIREMSGPGHFSLFRVELLGEW